MSFEFEYAGEAEYTVHVCMGMEIHISAAGGGTVGETYTGSWDTALVVHGRAIDVLEYPIDGHDALSTGTPKTHAQVARIYAGFMTVKLAEWSSDLANFAV